MEFIRTWILTITSSAMVIAAAEALMPQGAVKKAGRLTGGLILVLGLLQPLVSLDYEDLWDLAESLPAGAISQEEWSASALDPMKGIIEEELAAYIVDKGESLGAACQAQVTCEAGEEGIPIPRRVTVSGSFDEARKEALIQSITQDLGIPREYQIYVSEETP